MSQKPAWPVTPPSISVPLHRSVQDLECTPFARELAVRWARAWCTDRALHPTIATAVDSIVYAAVGYGLRFGPERVQVTMGWLDLDRFQIDLLWRGCASQARAAAPNAESLRRSIDLFDSASEQWGLETNGFDSWHWFTIDTRTPWRPDGEYEQADQPGDRPADERCESPSA